MRYLLDTNVVSDLIRNPQGRVAGHIRKVGEAQVKQSLEQVHRIRSASTLRDRHSRNKGR